MFQPNTQRNRKLNWNSLIKCDIEYIIRNEDLEQLESFLFPLQQAQISERDFMNPHNLIPLLKAVYLLQLLLLYLEYTKQYQDEMLKYQTEEEKQLQKEIDQMEIYLEKSKRNIVREKQKLLKAREDVKRQKQKQKHDMVYQCLYCFNKAFISIPLLDSHYQRHHGDKYIKPKTNQAETMLTMQTILLQQQINTLVNNQAQQDQMMLTMQQAQFFQEKADESDSSSGEDEEDVGYEKVQIDQVKFELEQTNFILQQRLDSLQTYVQVQQPLELLDKIDYLQNRVKELEAVVYRVPTVHDPTPEEIVPEYSYNAGNLEDDFSDLDDKDLFAKPESIKEEVESEGEKPESDHLSKMIDNQNEAEFLQEEKEFHNVIKKAKQKQLIFPKPDRDYFRDTDMVVEVEKKLKQDLQINLDELQNKTDKDLEEMLTKLYAQQIDFGNLFSSHKKGGSGQPQLSDSRATANLQVDEIKLPTKKPPQTTKFQTDSAIINQIQDDEIFNPPMGRLKSLSKSQSQISEQSNENSSKQDDKSSKSSKDNQQPQLLVSNFGQEKKPSKHEYVKQPMLLESGPIGNQQRQQQNMSQQQKFQIQNQLDLLNSKPQQQFQDIFQDQQIRQEQASPDFQNNYPLKKGKQDSFEESDVDNKNVPVVQTIFSKSKQLQPQQQQQQIQQPQKQEQGLRKKKFQFEQDSDDFGTRRAGNADSDFD